MPSRRRCLSGVATVAGIFCSLHRLPPNHDCPLIDQFVAGPARKREFVERAQGKAGSPQERVKAKLRNGLILRFSKLEIVHLVIGTALVTAVGLSLSDHRIFSTAYSAVQIHCSWCGVHRAAQQQQTREGRLDRSTDKSRNGRRVHCGVSPFIGAGL